MSAKALPLGCMDSLRSPVEGCPVRGDTAGCYRRVLDFARPASSPPPHPRLLSSPSPFCHSQV